MVRLTRRNLGWGLGGAALIAVLVMCRGTLFAPPPTPAGALVLAEARRQQGAPELIARLEKPGTGAEAMALRRRTLRALGRVGTPEAVAALLPVAAAPGPYRPEALRALGLLGDDAPKEAREVVGAACAPEGDPTVLEAAAWALGRVGDAAAIAPLGRLLEHQAAPVRAAAALALGLLGRREHALNGAVRAQLARAAADPDLQVRYGAVYALGREHAPPSEELEVAALRQAARDADPEVRALAVFALAKRELDEIDVFGAALEDVDWRVQVEAVRALGRNSAAPPWRETLAAWTMLAWDALGGEAGPGQHGVLEALTAMSEAGLEEPVWRALDEVYADSAARLREHDGDVLLLSAAHCLAAAARVRAAAPIEDLLGCGGPTNAGMPVHERKRLLALVLQEGQVLDAARRIALWTPLSEDKDPRVRAVAIEQGLRGEDIEIRLRAQAAARQALERDPSPIVVGTIADAVGADGVEAEPLLRAALVARARRETGGDPEIRLTLIGALRTLGAAEAQDLLLSAAQDPNETIRAAAREALAEVLPNAQLPPPAAPAAPPLPPVDGPRALGQPRRWSLLTSRGEIIIALDADTAPWAVAALSQLAGDEFYSGLLWHRVVPGFVVQGGDPTGSGWGGPGYVLPAEASELTFARGAVGIADAGKDTGGCQLFIMHARAPHLEGRYTRVGQVVAGMPAVDTLMVGDVIESSHVD